MPYVLFVLICLIWGSSFILMKYALLSFGSVGVAAWRVVLGGLVLGVLWWRQKIGWPFTRRDIVPVVLLSALGYAAPFVAQPFLIREVDRIAGNGSAFVGMMVCFVPLVTIVCSVPMLQRRPAVREVIGVIGGLGCMAVILADGLRSGVPVAYILLAFFVPVVYALTNVYVKRRFAETPTMALSCIFLAVASAILVPIALATEEVLMNDEFTVAALCLAGLGAVGTGLATYWFFLMVQRQGPLFAGMCSYLIPIVALAWGWADEERITPAQTAAVIGVLAMVAIVQYGAGGTETRSS